jgi:glycosyltransferase involved in cell wall biosynthesis
MKVLLAHPGTQHSFTLAAQLSKRKLLHEFWTCFGLTDGKLRRRAVSALPSFLQRKLENRFAFNLSRQELKTIPWLEFNALRQLKSGINDEEVMMERNGKFQRAIAAESIAASDTVIGFDTSSWLLVDRAHRAGKPFVLDQSHAHPRAGAESARKVARDFPAWEETFPPMLPELLEKQEQEYEQADVIVTASSFGRETLIANEVRAEKIRMNPYGVDLKAFRPREQEARSEPFRFIFTGSILARKGVPLLLAAWQKLRAKDAELWLLGQVAPGVRKLIPDLPGLHVLGRRPRSELIDLLRSCDVFVLPSYFEGFGLVLLEALACGLPVITTTATAGPDVITRDHDGWVIEPGNLEALAEAMEFCLANRDRVIEMGVNARRTAERFSWDAYGERWLKILEAVTARKN